MQYSGQQNKIREMITSQNLKNLFLDKLFSQYKSVKRAFTEMNRHKNGFIVYEDFEEVIKEWGFIASKDLIRDLFNWLDMDKD